MRLRGLPIAALLLLAPAVCRSASACVGGRGIRGAVRRAGADRRHPPSLALRRRLQRLCLAGARSRSRRRIFARGARAAGEGECRIGRRVRLFHLPVGGRLSGGLRGADGIRADPRRRPPDAALHAAAGAAAVQPRGRSGSKSTIRNITSPSRCRASRRCGSSMRRRIAASPCISRPDPMRPRRRRSRRSARNSGSCRPRCRR